MPRGRGWEGSKQDVAEDKRLAKRHGMSLKKWERSAADKRHDAPKSTSKFGPAKAAKGAPKDRIVPIPGTAGVKEDKKASRAQRVARMEKKNGRV